MIAEARARNGDSAPHRGLGFLVACHVIESSAERVKREAYIECLSDYFIDNTYSCDTLLECFLIAAEVAQRQRQVLAVGGQLLGIHGAKSLR